MGKGYIKQNSNIYFQARKAAAAYNEKLCSREGAAELLGLSVASLADYELGNIKTVPVDKVVLMADLYRCPELKYQYCKNECPIGSCLPIATQQRTVEKVAVRLLSELDTDGIEEMLKAVVKVAADGEIKEDELQQVRDISKKMSCIQKAISEYQLMVEKMEDRR